MVPQYELVEYLTLDHLLHLCPSELISHCDYLALLETSTFLVYVAGICHNSPMHSMATFNISSAINPSERSDITAIVVPRVTRDLPVQLNSAWNHLSGLYLSDPDFGRPGKIDIVLGVDVYASARLQGRRSGLPGTPVALETKFGCFFAGNTNLSLTDEAVRSHHITVSSDDDILKSFGKLKKPLKAIPTFFQNNALSLVISLSHQGRKIYCAAS